MRLLFFSFLQFSSVFFSFLELSVEFKMILPCLQWEGSVLQRVAPARHIIHPFLLDFGQRAIAS